MYIQIFILVKAAFFLEGIQRSSLIAKGKQTNKHCVKSVQIRSYFWSVFSCIRTEYGDLRSKSPGFSPNTGKYGPEITPYLETFHTVKVRQTF